jgi:hypothetical protein
MSYPLTLFLHYFILNLTVESVQLVRRYTGGHKGAISCLMTFMSAAGEVKLWHDCSPSLVLFACASQPYYVFPLLCRYELSFVLYVGLI